MVKKCEHSDTGKPFGYPMFCCAWPGCPMGVDAPVWVLQYGCHGEKLDRAEFTRERYIDGDGKETYSWKKIE